MTENSRPRLPHWLRRPLPAGQNFDITESTLEDLSLQTICMHANCPNRGQCWTRGTATVLILGNVCTRNCKFCSVATGKPEPPDSTEPKRLAKMVEQMKLKYLVLTSVNRDDLPDRGASHFRDCILEVRKANPDTQFEILTPDFMGTEPQALEILNPALPFVFAHNVETVPDLYPVARKGGNYQGSLALLALAKQVFGPIQTKSSIMLGLGETENQVINTLKDLRRVQCDRLTIGQYLKPDKHALDVVEYITPEKFEWWQQTAQDHGFEWIISEPFARSSYFAERE